MRGERGPGEERPERLQPARVAVALQPLHLAGHVVAGDVLLGEDAVLRVIAAERLHQRRRRPRGQHPGDLLAQLGRVHGRDEVDGHVVSGARARVQGEPVDRLAVAGAELAHGGAAGGEVGERDERASAEEEDRGAHQGGVGDGLEEELAGAVADAVLEPHHLAPPVLGVVYGVDGQTQVRSHPVGEAAAQAVELLAGARRQLLVPVQGEAGERHPHPGVPARVRHRLGGEEAQGAHEDAPVGGVAHLLQRAVGAERGEERPHLRIGEPARAERQELVIAESSCAEPVEEEAQGGEGGPGRLAGQERLQPQAPQPLVRRVGGAAQEGAAELGQLVVVGEALLQMANGGGRLLEAPPEELAGGVSARVGGGGRLEEGGERLRLAGRGPEAGVDAEFGPAAPPPGHQRAVGLLAKEGGQLLVAEPERRPRQERAEVEAGAGEAIGEVAQPERPGRRRHRPHPNRA